MAILQRSGESLEYCRHRVHGTLQRTGPFKEIWSFYGRFQASKEVDICPGTVFRVSGVPAAMIADRITAKSSHEPLFSFGSGRRWPEKVFYGAVPFDFFVNNLPLSVKFSSQFITDLTLH